MKKAVAAHFLKKQSTWITMNKDNKKIHFQIDGLLKLKKVGDYLNLVDKKVRLTFKKKDAGLNTKKIFRAEVAELSETCTHLMLRQVHIKRYFFFSTYMDTCNVPIKNIHAIQILDKYGKTD